MAFLARQLSAIASDVFEAESLERRWGMVRVSDRPELADFQCNGCMGAAKQAGTNPRELAAKIAPKLAEHELIDSVEVAGPGFLNIKVTDAALTDVAEFVRSDALAGGIKVEAPQNIMIDFGGPNVAKPMHVGHLRSAVIGDTLQRLMRFMGDEVTSDTHLGDWGLQMGHLITELYDEQPDLIYFDADFTGPYPADPPVTIDDLGRLYPAASAKAKEDSDRNERSQMAVAELQEGRPGYRALLKHFIDVSVAALKDDYAFLNVSFDLWKGESDVDHLIPGIIAEFREKGLSEADAGAVIVRVERDSDKKDMPPIMLVNSRGGTGYHTTDLATIKDRMDMTPPPDRMLYVVDARQSLHFEQVYRAAELAGMISADRLEHIGFGTVNGPDGKPFKTREGGVLRLSDLNQMALDEADKKLQELDDAGKLPADMDAGERADVAAKVAVAALRFADLQNTRTTNYIFDLARFTSFEGKTGPYCLYQAVRIKSLLRRAQAEGHAPGAIKVESDAERALALALDKFPAALQGAYDKRMPHILCEHVYNLASSFSAFYGAHPIAAEPDAAIRASRLGLCEAVLKQLECGLDLLGINVPERM